MGRTEPQIAETDEDIARCFTAMHQLRPHLVRDEFVSRIRRQQEDGFRLAYLAIDGHIVAVAGYRISEKLSSGRFLFVDDLVTDEMHRSQGYGARLLDWLRKQAIAAGCGRLQLDTAVNRKDAQRFYDREGMRVVGYHYEMTIGGAELGA